MSNRIACIGSINKDDVLLSGASNILHGNNAFQGKKISYLSTLNSNASAGFATSTDAFREFLEFNGLTEWMDAQLEHLDVSDVNQLTELGKSIRQKIIHGCMPEELAEEVSFAYKTMINSNTRLPVVEVKASATTGDMSDELFSGQQLTFYNIKGVNNIIDAIKKVYASLYNDSLIADQVNKNIPYEQLEISVTVQHMLSSDEERVDIVQSIHKASKRKEKINKEPGTGEYIQLGYYSPTQRFTVLRK